LQGPCIWAEPHSPREYSETGVLYQGTTFSRAEQRLLTPGFSPCAFPRRTRIISDADDTRLCIRAGLDSLPKYSETGALYQGTTFSRAEQRSKRTGLQPLRLPRAAHGSFPMLTTPGFVSGQDLTVSRNIPRPGLCIRARLSVVPNSSKRTGLQPLRFVSGHDFSRAEQRPSHRASAPALCIRARHSVVPNSTQKGLGFSPCALYQGTTFSRAEQLKKDWA